MRTHLNGKHVVRILHLEDDPGDALLVRSTLESEGIDCEIVQADSRERFTSALQSGQFDLILSDYALPAFDGISALRLTREKDPDIPFLFVSGTMGEELAIETLREGATDYVLKDRITRLPGSVRRALSEARERRARRLAEKSLRESEEKYRSLVETTNDWIWAMSADGHITYNNRTVEAILGYRPEELAEHDTFALIHEEDLPKARLVLAEARREKKGWSGVILRWRHKDGGYRHLEDNATPVVTPEGELAGFRRASRDITGRIELQAQFRQSQKMEAIGRLAGGVAHDFNNLLTAILGYSDVVLAALPPHSSIRDDVEEVRRAGERAAALTRQLLAFSRKQVLQPVVFDVNEVVQELEKMLRRLIGEDIDFALSLTPEIGFVRADPGQLEQIVMNLAVNARDAMPQGGKLTIETADCEVDAASARQHPGLTVGGYVALSVSDNGMGMDADTRSRIFEPFFTTKEKGKGTGLGLSTVYGIVKQSGGYIAVDSEPGRGTSFKIYLPRAEKPIERPKARGPAMPSSGSETILLVEDEAPLRALSRRALESRGYTILEASSAEQALSILEDHSKEIELMVTDAVLPGASGPELARAVAVSRRAMKVLFVSGFTEDAIVRNGLLAPGHAFLQKPFTPDALNQKVRELLDLSAVRDESHA